MPEIKNSSCTDLLRACVLVTRVALRYDHFLQMQNDCEKLVVGTVREVLKNNNSYYHNT